MSTIRAFTFSLANVVLSNFERHFGITSTQSSWIYTGNEFAQVVLFLLPLFQQKIRRRPLIIAWSLVISAFGLYILGAAAFIVPVPNDQSSLGQNHVKLCSQNVTTLCENLNNGMPDNDGSKWIGMLTMFMGMFIVGISGSVFNTFGHSYADDNLNKDHAPYALSAIWASRFVGRGLGFLLGAYCLKLYVLPWASQDFQEGENK